MTLWPVASAYIDKVIEFLNEDGNVYYYKTLNLSYKASRNLAFNMYSDFTIKDRYTFIDKKLEYANISTSNPNNIIGIILYDNVNNKHLAGQGSSYKKSIRAYILKLLKDNQIDIKNIRGNDLIHINDFYYQTIEYGQTYFNKNSLDLLNKQNIDRMYTYRFNRAFLKYQTLKKWMYTNLNATEIIRLCLFGGSVLYTYGLRPANDLDGLILNTYKETEADNRLESLIYKYFVNEETKYLFSDIDIVDSAHWKPQWTDKNKELSTILKVSSLDEIVMNPQHHYYYNGIKLWLFDYELVKKFIRFRAQDIADFAIILKHFNYITSNLSLNDNKQLIIPSYAGQIKNIKYTFSKALQLIHERYSAEDYKDITFDTLNSIFN